MRPATRLRASIWGLALAAAAGGGCANDPFDPSTLPNQPPVVRIFVGGELQATSYNGATFHWAGSDPDGRVIGYHVGISLDEDLPKVWAFTTEDDTTRTYDTDQEGRAAPTLYVVAQDDRGALSDTASVTFPLVNFPPVLEFIRDFEPLAQSFGAASFEFLGFDLDGDETLEPFVDIRYEGADSTVVVPEGDPGADPANTWVRLDRSPTRFSLGLRDIPAGDPNDEFRQTLHVRIEDEAGSSTEFRYTWQVFEVRGEVLLVDDNRTQAARDLFYRDALTAHLGDQYSVWEISGGLPSRAEDLWLTLSQFDVIVWYTSSSASENLGAAQSALQRFVETDLHPEIDGIQTGRLLLENQAVVGPNSNLTGTFRSRVLGLSSSTDPRNALERYDIARNTIGTLEIFSQVAGLPDLNSEGLNYTGGSGIYFGLVGIVPLADSQALWKFESYRWGGPADPSCRLGCEPIVAVRTPATGTARSVTLAFQLDYANAAGNAIDALRTLLSDHLGVAAVNP